MGGRERENLAPRRPRNEKNENRKKKKKMIQSHNTRFRLFGGHLKVFIRWLSPSELSHADRAWVAAAPFRSATRIETG